MELDGADVEIGKTKLKVPPAWMSRIADVQFDLKKIKGKRMMPQELKVIF